MAAPRYQNQFDLPPPVLAYACLVRSDIICRERHPYSNGARILALAAQREYEIQLGAFPGQIDTIVAPQGAVYPPSLWLFDVHQRSVQYVARALRNWLDEHFIGVYSIIVPGTNTLRLLEAALGIPRGMILESVEILATLLHEGDKRRCRHLLDDLLSVEADGDEAHHPLVLHICRHEDVLRGINDVDFTVTLQGEQENEGRIQVDRL